MKKTTTVELLRLIYKNLDLRKMLRENPSLTKSQVDGLFKEFARFLQGKDTTLPQGQGARQRTTRGTPAALIVYSDGASRGNPGDAGVGVVITDPRGRPVLEAGDAVGRTTNNLAEYAAAIRGLQEALRLGARQVTLRSDSELLVKQIRGDYRVRSRALLPLHEELRALANRFQSFQAEHIPREQNMRADALAKQAAYDGQRHVFPE